MTLKNKTTLYITLLVIMALAIRISFTSLPSFEYDESAYRSWSQRLVELGPSRFYSSEVFTNNPLGGLYAFWFMGILKTMFFPGVSFLSRDFDILLKLPASIADIASALLIFSLIKRSMGIKWGITGFLMYSLNPALIFNSSIWGQYDGLSTFFLLLSTYMIMVKKNPELSSISYAAAWAIKPQAIFFAPVLFLLILTQQKPLRWITSSFSALITLLLIYFPFFPENPFMGIVYVNTNSATLFTCTTCFAFNYWGIFGNWLNDLDKFFNIPLFIWGIISLLTTLIFIFFLKPFFKKFKEPLFYLTASISIMAFFTLLTRMHERYLFPFFAFMLLAALILRSKILIGLYIFVSLLHLLNLYIPYAYYNNQAGVSRLPVENLVNNFNYFSLLSLLVFVLFFIYYQYYVKYHSTS